MPIALVVLDHAEGQLAVWDPGPERLVEGSYCDFPIRRSRAREERGGDEPGLRDVAYDLDDTGGAILHAERPARGDLDHERDAVRVQRGRERAKRIRLSGPDQAVDVVAAAGGEHRAERDTEDLFGQAPEHLARASVPRAHGPVEADEHQGIAASRCG